MTSSRPCRWRKRPWTTWTRPGSSGRRGPTARPTPIPNTADTGYFSEKAVEGLEKIGMDPHIAVGRQKHHEAPVPARGGSALG